MCTLASASVFAFHVASCRRRRYSHRRFYIRSHGKEPDCFSRVRPALSSVHPFVVIFFFFFFWRSMPTVWTVKLCCAGRRSSCFLIHFFFISDGFAASVSAFNFFQLLSPTTRYRIAQKKSFFYGWNVISWLRCLFPCVCVYPPCVRIVHKCECARPRPHAGQENLLH